MFVVRNRSMSVRITTEMDSDHVPLGMVNSMKQRLMDKFNQGIETNGTLHSKHRKLIKSSNENLLLEIKPTLKRTTRLSRSHENLLNDQSYQMKTNLIIIDKTSAKIKRPGHHFSQTNLNRDEVPKPGTVITVKNMFERQIRLSRSDTDRTHSNSSTIHSRRHTFTTTRARSISPNDMALRQRRTTVTLSNPYPDVVISHTPNPTSQTDVLSKPNGTKRPASMYDIPLTKINDVDRMDSSRSSDTAKNEPIDFKSRLALFNRTNHQEPTVNTSSSSVPVKVHFLTKPVVHHPSDKRSNKSLTFFGGTIFDEPQLFPLTTPSLAPLSIILDEPPLDTRSATTNVTKSSIFSGTKKEVRVQFVEKVHTFEYLSYDAAMAEYDGIDGHENEMDVDSPVEKDLLDEEDDEGERVARVNTQWNTKNLAEKSVESRGSLHTFRPAHLHSYELGEQKTSDISSLSLSKENPSLFRQELNSFDMANHIPWSSMSSNSDLLF